MGPSAEFILGKDEGIMRGLAMLKKRIKDKLDSVLKTIVWYNKPLIRKCIRHPVVIFKMDGGTCSQLNNYVSMKMLEERTGTNMIMDLGWYDRYGKGEGGKIGNDSVLARPYNIDKLFDLKEYQAAGKVQAWLYKVLFAYFPPRDMVKRELGVDLSTFKLPPAPCYLHGYFKYRLSEIEKNIDKYCTLKSKEEILDDENMEIYQEILACANPIGVHVRRGDMAVEGGYWKVLPEQYFINVCEDLKGSDSMFFFFSEEPQWVLEHIIPFVDIRYRVVNNSAFYGYRDLYLLSQCRYVVRSQGSFGEYAYMINKREDRKLIAYNKDNLRLWEWRSEYEA